MIKFTEQALAHFRQKMSPGQYLEIAVKRYGCSGYAYECSLVDQPRDGFSVITVDDVRVSYDTDKHKYLDGLTVDYKRHGLGSRVTYINPNETARCGCGESVQFDQD